MSTNAPLPSIIRYKRVDAILSHSLELLSLEQEINELLLKSHLNERQKESFKALVGSMFDLFQMPVKKVESGEEMVESCLIDNVSVRLYERFQMVVLLLSQFTMKVEKIEDPDFKINDNGSELNLESQIEAPQLEKLSQTPDLSQQKLRNNRESVINLQMKRDRTPSSIFYKPSPSPNIETVQKNPSLKPEISLNQGFDNYRSPFRDPKIANIHHKFEKITKNGNDSLNQELETPLKMGFEPSNSLSNVRHSSRSNSIQQDVSPTFSVRQEDYIRTSSPVRSMSHYTPPSTRQTNYSVNARAMSYNLNHSPSSYKSREDFNKRASIRKSMEQTWTREQIQEMAKRERYLRTRSVYESRDTLKGQKILQYNNNNNNNPSFNNLSPQNKFSQISSSSPKFSKKTISIPTPINQKNRYSMLSNNRYSRTPSKMDYDDSFMCELKGQNSDDDERSDHDGKEDEFEDMDDYDLDINRSHDDTSSRIFSTRF